MTNPVGVITRAIAVIADAIVLGLTLWKTLFIFRVEKEARAATKLTTTLAYNGTIYLFVIRLSLMDLGYRQYSIRV